MVLITSNIAVTVLNMLFTFPFTVFLYRLRSSLSPCVNYNDKCQKKKAFSKNHIEVKPMLP